MHLNFFKHPFIVKFVASLNKSKSFGRVKEWIQRNCTNVPVPNRRELTANVRTLFDWLIELDPDSFVVERPRHAEVLFRKNPK